MEYFRYSQINPHRLVDIAFQAIIKSRSLIDICNPEELKYLKYDIDTMAAYQQVRNNIVDEFDNILTGYEDPYGRDSEL